MKIQIRKSFRMNIIGKFQTYAFETEMEGQMDIAIGEQDVDVPITDDLDVLLLGSFQERAMRASEEIQALCIHEVYKDIDTARSNDKNFAVVYDARSDELGRARIVLERQGKA